jgi:flagellar biosynthesis chaperone FliJ
LLRFNDFAAERQKSTIAQARQVNGLFQSVQQATQEVEEARLLAERTLFLATRMPLMAGYFADVWLSQMTVNPQAQNLIANLDRMTDVAERMATVAEKFPQDVGEVRENLIRQAAEEMNRLSQINIERIAEKVAVERETAIRQFMSDLGKERHKAIQDLVSEEERINRMLADLRQSLEESTRFMAALNLFMEHLAPLVAEEKLAEDPFDINEYAQTATNIGNAAQELNTLAITFKEVLDAPGWQIVLPRIEAAINRAGTEGEELIDHTFKQTALLILLFLVGYVLARLFLDNLKRKQKHS